MKRNSINRKSKSRKSGPTRPLLEGLEELENIVRNSLTLEDLKDRLPTRVRIVAPQPGRHAPAAVKALRQRMGATQADFAALVGVSRILVQSWERGVRQPSPLARRLLDTISADPAGWLAELRRRAG